MEIKTVSNPWITRAESVRRSDRFIVACAGQSASIFDKDLNMIKQFRGLSYVYESRISPDESKIALISNCNWFHVVDTETFSITRMRMKGISGGDLDGKGCWSYDGKRLYLIPYDADTDNSVVRIYDAFDWSYTDMLRDRYFLTAMSNCEVLSKRGQTACKPDCRCGTTLFREIFSTLARLWAW